MAGEGGVGAVQGWRWGGGGWAVQGEQHMQRLRGRRPCEHGGEGGSGEEVGETTGTVASANREDFSFYFEWDERLWRGLSLIIRGHYQG